MGALLRNLVLIAGCTVFAGTLCNLIAHAANGGYMPVLVAGCPEGLRLSGTHVCGGPGTRLGFLCDYIWLGKNIYSPGDLAVDYGAALGVPSMVLWALVFAARKVWAFCKLAV